MTDADFLAAIRACPTGVPAGDARWPMILRLEGEGRVRLEWWGPRAAVVRVVDGDMGIPITELSQ
jgi:hypothetical protein